MFIRALQMSVFGAYWAEIVPFGVLNGRGLCTRMCPCSGIGLILCQFVHDLLAQSPPLPGMGMSLGDTIDWCITV